MRENQAVPVRKAALVLYIFLTVILLIAGAAYYTITAYYPLEHEEIIVECAEEYGIDPNMICAVIATESRFSEEAESQKGAVGLMQIMPDTGEWIAGKLRMEFSEEDLKDPAVNIRMGTWYLNFLAERFQGEQDTIIAAYNAGHGNVEKWLEEPQYSPDGRTLSVIPFDETRNYVKKVNLAYEIYKTFYQVG